METTINQATSCKDNGNQLFKSGDYIKALEQYSQAIQCLQPLLSDQNKNKDNQDQTTKNLLETLLTNRAAVYLKTNAYLSAYNDCHEVLDKHNKVNTKALYRSAQAIYHGKLTIGQTSSSATATAAVTTTSYQNTYDYNTAIKHLTQLLHVDPKNADGIALMREIRVNLSAEHGIGGK